ncbi:COA8 family protein CG14806, mitochondrial [Bradysia coprophila]|uniref:COA8 family protein CG14806, mitochondrial n=1 Tax=Bradysia coprophila TaxID=38358 RepID=UPI00187DB5BC|nr:COA8 family protein CG14806, mitochondrial [Bradysia coprophila]
MNRKILLNCEWTLKRVLSTNAKKFDGTANVSELTKDYIGPPDIKSNIRPVIRHIPENETNTERLLRTRATEIEKWNHQIWESHNKRFFDEREAFIAANKDKGSDTVPADKMSEFYKYFLDKNWSLHFYYNVSWYMKNVELLLLSAQVNISQIFRKLRNKTRM